MSAKLEGEVREALGSRPSRKLRAGGRIPVSIHGENREHVHASIDEREFLLARQRHQHLFDIGIDGGTETVVVRELQYDSFGDRVVHVEFQRVVRGRKMETEVELVFVGHPKGGILQHLVTHLTVRSLPSEIPDGIEVRVDSLEVGDTITAADLELPRGVELAATQPDAQVAVIVAPRGMEAEPEAAAEEAPEPGAAPPPPRESAD